MNQAFYPLLIRIVVQAHKESNDIIMETNRLVPFVPCNGLGLELSRDEDDEVCEIGLDGVVYSYKESAFVVKLEDSEGLREDTGFQDERVKYYRTFGFRRVG